jgi:prepilin-type processing-associated H-X9-DG protein
LNCKELRRFLSDNSISYIRAYFSDNTRICHVKIFHFWLAKAEIPEILISLMNDTLSIVPSATPEAVNSPAKVIHKQRTRGVAAFLPNGDRRLRTEEELQESVEAYRRGESTMAIAMRYGLSGPAVRKSLLARGIVFRSRTEAVRLIPRKLALNESAFDVLTPEACYWAGFLFADGHVGNNAHEGRPVLALGLAEVDGYHVRRFRDFLGSEHAIRTQIRNRDNLKGTFKNATPCISVSVRSRRLVERLRAIGMNGLKSDPIPELRSSRDFWRGVIDGDGFPSIQQVKSHRVKGTDRFTKPFQNPVIGLVGGRPIIRRFVDFVRSICPEVKKSYSKHSSIFRKQLSGDAAIIITRRIYGLACVSLDRKQKIADEIMEIPTIQEAIDAGIYEHGGGRPPTVSNEDATKIIREYLMGGKGIGMKEIGEKYNTSLANVSVIMRGNRRIHVS